MSIRSMSALALGAVLLLAGCNDDGGDGAFSPADASDQTSDQAAPEQEQSYNSYADFPGDELVYYASEYETIGLRVKAAGAQWATEFLDQTAAPDTHYLVIYLAVTGELDDRGKDNAGLATVDYSIGLRFEPTGQCDSADSKYGSNFCYLDGWGAAIASAQLEPLASNDWANYLWVDGMVTGVPIEAGQTMVGAVGFNIADDVDAAGDFEFCARGKDNTLENDEFPCIAVPEPEPRA